jgi:hypothetical protein
MAMVGRTFDGFPVEGKKFGELDMNINSVLLLNKGFNTLTILHISNIYETRNRLCVLFKKCATVKRIGEIYFLHFLCVKFEIFFNKKNNKSKYKKCKIGHDKVSDKKNGRCIIFRCVKSTNPYATTFSYFSSYYSMSLCHFVVPRCFCIIRWSILMDFCALSTNPSIFF